MSVVVDATRVSASSAYTATTTPPAPAPDGVAVTVPDSTTGVVSQPTSNAASTTSAPAQARRDERRARSDPTSMSSLPRVCRPFSLAVARLYTFREFDPTVHEARAGAEDGCPDQVAHDEGEGGQLGGVLPRCRPPPTVSCGDDGGT